MLVVGMLSCTATSASAAGWLEPEDISAANEVVDGRPDVAVDAAGDAVAIWERHVGGEEVVEASERPAGGEWSEPEVLSLPGEEGRRSQVAIDAAGNAIAIWVTGGITDYFVRTAARPSGGEWSAPEDLSELIEDPIQPRVALDAGSEAVAVWTTLSAGDRIVQGAVRSANGQWSEPDDLSDTGQDVNALLDAPDAAIDAAGNAVAVWTRFNGSDEIVQAAVRPAGGDWAEPDDLSAAGQDAGEPAVAIEAAGEAVAVWHRSNGANLILQGAVRPAGGDWAEPDDLSAAGQNAAEPDVAVDQEGRAVAVWSRFNGANHIIQGAVRPAGGEWADPDDLSASGRNAFVPVVATNDAVGAVASWSRSDGANQRVQASVRPPGGGWSEPDTLSAAGERAGFSQLALDAAGDAFAVFGRDGDDGPFVQATAYDLSAPRLDGLQVPAAGTVGEPVTFGVSSFDVFPFATSWTFGDGSQAGGNTVSHVYASPGAYPVTVSAVDGGGNTSTQIGAIAIAPRPPDPRPQITLALRIEGSSLKNLRRSGVLRVAASVNEAASVALSGRAKLRVRRARGRPRTKLVPVLAPKTVRLAAEAEGKVTLALSKRGRKALRPLSRVRLLIAGEAREDAGGTATKTLARTLR
jgi:hypothetical protein